MKKLTIILAGLLAISGYAFSCDPPVSISLGEYRDGSIGIFWSTEGGDHYKVQLLDGNGDVIKDTTVGPCHDCYHYRIPLVFTNPGLPLCGRVATFCSSNPNDLSAFSPSIVIIAGGYCGGGDTIPACTVPSDLAVFSVTSTSAVVTWTTSPEVDFYFAGCRRATNSNVNTARIAGTDDAGDIHLHGNYAEFNGLAPNRNYKWVVASVCDNFVNPVNGIVGPDFRTLPLRLSELTQVTTESIDIYPNPSYGNISVTYISNSDAEVLLQVYDMAGRIVYKQEDHVIEGSNTFSLNFPGLSNGIYLFEVSNGTSAGRMKFVIQK